MAVVNPELYLEVGGHRFGGWLRVRVERAVDKACTQFGVITTRSWPGKDDPWLIVPGDKVVVRVNEETVCTGWIDKVSPDYDATKDEIQVEGRGLVCDLVDCSYLGPPWQWKNVDGAEIIRTIAKQFDISVKFDVDLGKPLDNFTINQGETGWAAIERITRLRQVLAYDQADGSLLITRGSDQLCETKLVKGGEQANILSASTEIDDRERFSRYIVKGQQKGKKGSKEVSPEQAAQSLGEITDPSLRRDRPMLIVQSADTDNGTALDRAKWEKQNRWGRGRTSTITVQGWLMPNGATWPINRLCDVEDPWLGIDHQLAITAASLDAGAQGLRTVLTLQPPEALIPEPPSKEPKTKPEGGGGQDFWSQVASDRKAGEARRQESKQ